MKSLYILLAAIILFSFAGLAQAQDDPYSGSYTCSGQPQYGCGSCTDIEFDPFTRVTVSKVDNNQYQLCPEWDNDKLGLRNDEGCVVGTVVDGQAHWDESQSGGGYTFNGQVTVTFSGSQLTAEETGQLSGECSCEVHLQTVCTK